MNPDILPPADEAASSVSAVPAAIRFKTKQVKTEISDIGKITLDIWRLRRHILMDAPTD
jgi:hypothetical protein